MSTPDHAEALLFLSYEPTADPPPRPTPPRPGCIDVTWSHAGTNLPS